MNKDQAIKKKQAFMSFLETSASPSSQIKKNTSENQTTTSSMFNNRIIAMSAAMMSPMVQQKRNGFCEQVTCLDHLRKRRRRKNKWQKICDNCEDKYLYDFYMKLQIKAEQSLTVEQEIVTMKYQDKKQILENKRQKRRELSFICSQLQRKHDQKMNVLMKEDNRHQSMSNKLESDELTCCQVEQYIHRMENKIKSNFEQDYRILAQEDGRLAAQLFRVEKRCSQVRNAIEKREKQLEQAYQQWQRKQFGKSQESQVNVKKVETKNQNCIIF